MPTAATQITLAAVRFAQATRAARAPDRWTVWLGARRLTVEELSASLDAMPKPVLVGALVEPGGVLVLPLDSVASDVRPDVEHEWRNQGQYLHAEAGCAQPQHRAYSGPARVGR